MTTGVKSSSSESSDSSSSVSVRSGSGSFSGSGSGGAELAAPLPPPLPLLRVRLRLPLAAGCEAGCLGAAVEGVWGAGWRVRAPGGYGLTSSSNRAERSRGSFLLVTSGLEKPWKSGEASGSFWSSSLAVTLWLISVSCLAVALWFIQVSVLSLEETGVPELELCRFRGITTRFHFTLS